MSYQSIDALQRALAANVFLHTADKKKASGRALGTLVEIITYYLFKVWGLSQQLTIEHRLQEFANKEITHNVEFALHPRLGQSGLVSGSRDKSFTISALKKDVKFSEFCKESGSTV